MSHPKIVLVVEFELQALCDLKVGGGSRIP